MKNGKSVEFVLEMPKAEHVNVAGTFNNWDPNQYALHRGMDGRWRRKVSLPAGHYEYRFIVDNQWMSDPHAKSTPNTFGGDNSVIDT